MSVVKHRAESQAIPHVERLGSSSTRGTLRHTWRWMLTLRP